MSNASNTLFSKAIVNSGMAWLIGESARPKSLGLFFRQTSCAQFFTLTIFMNNKSIEALFDSIRIKKINNVVFSYAVIEFIVVKFRLLFYGIFSAITDFQFDALFLIIENSSTNNTNHL